ncbi:MAG: helix-turn-helix transcriptional regulator [Bacteroidota bacterium]
MIEFLVSSGIGISVFVLVYLLRHSGIKLLSRRIAMSIQALWIVRFTLFYLKPEAEPVYNAYLILSDQALLFLDGLLVWLYVRALLRPENTFKYIWLHFVPFGVVFSYSMFIATFRHDEVITKYNANIELLKNNQSSLSTPEVLLIVFLVGLNLFYLFRSVKITKSYNKKLQENLSTTDHLTITWVKTFQNLWAILFVVPLMLYFLNDLYRFTEHLSLGYALIFTFVLLSMVFNFFLLEQVYRPVFLFKSEPIEEVIPEPKNEHQQQLEKLISLLEEKQYYLDDELSLKQLAAYMDLKPPELTDLIKFSPYENFYDLINSYRIEAVKKELVASKDQIIQIAYQNGFRSKSTFNKIFKEKTGMTPRAYRVSLK